MGVSVIQELELLFKTNFCAAYMANTLSIDLRSTMYKRYYLTIPTLRLLHVRISRV